MLHLGNRLSGAFHAAPAGFSASFAASLSFDAASGAIGTVSVAGAEGPVTLVGGPREAVPGSAGGAFDVTDASGPIEVSFDRAGLGDGFVQGQSVVTTLDVDLTDGLSTTTVTLRVTILRQNTAPVLGSTLPDLTLDIDVAMVPADLSVGFSDPGDTLTFVAGGLPAGLSVSTAGLLSGTPTAAVAGQIVTVTATDSIGQTATAAFQITVEAALTVSTDPDVQTIDAEGWFATHANPGTVDPVGDPKHVVVTRAGFDAAGTAHTFDEPLLITSRIREPFPNQATLTASDVALADFVYATDTISGVTNGSTRAAPAPQAMWLNHDLEHVTTTTHTFRLAVAHAHARAGRPVAAVRFTATDQSGNVTAQTVSTMSAVSYTSSGLTVPHFAATLDFSTLTAGEMVTIDATIYPWVGTAFTLSTDADPYPSPNLTVLNVLNDRDSAYGTTYAYVDGAGAGTPQVSADPVVAAANPFASILAAATAIQTHNDTTHGRVNVSGGIIRLEPGVYTHAKFSSVAVGEIPLVVEAADPAQVAATVLQDAGSSISKGLPEKLILRDLTLRRNATGSVIFLDNTAVLGGAHMMVIERCIWDDNGLGPSWGAWVYRTGRMWNIDCSGVDCGQCVTFSSVAKMVLSIGSGEGSLRSGTYHALGCRDLDGTFSLNAAVSARPASVGDFLGWSFIGQNTDSVRCVSFNGIAIGARGAAVVGCVLEQYGGTTAQSIYISADGDTSAIQNVNLALNSALGARSSLLYQDTGTARVDKTMSQRFCVHDSRNTKSDIFASQSTLVGNWPVIYQVGHRANAALGASANADDPGVGSWLGEIAAEGDVSGTETVPLDAAWLDDRSMTGSGTGGGDYTPGAAHQLPLIPAGLAPYPVDLLGRVIADDGTAVIGAVQQ